MCESMTSIIVKKLVKSRNSKILEKYMLIHIYRKSSFYILVKYYLMKKKLYLIPWLFQDATSNTYKPVTKLLQKQWYIVIPVQIDWKYKTMKEYVEQCIDFYYKTGADWDVHLFGFSYWAMIAIIVSSFLNIEAQFLCSLSPYFAEDLPYIPRYWKKYIWNKRVHYFKSLSFKQLAKNNNTKTYIFYWEKEHPTVEKRADNAWILLKNSKIIKIPDAVHDIWSTEYIKGLSDFFILK